MQPSLFQPEDLPLSFEAAAADDRLAAGVVFPFPQETVYWYLVPEALRELVRPGQRVRAPYGRGEEGQVGFVVAIATDPPTTRRLKSITELLDRDPLLSGPMLELTRWIGERYLCGWGQVLGSVVPAGVKKQSGTREIVCYELAVGAKVLLQTTKLAVKQKAIVDLLATATHALTIEEITTGANCGTGPLDALRKRRLVVPVRRRTELNPLEDELAGPAKHATEADLQLNADQQHALDRILQTLRERQFATLLLHGVTGSGKTEVYIQAIREVVSYGRQAIVLVPEISLTPQTIRRFRSRFPQVAVLHSHLSDSERHRHWQRIAQGEVQVIVGARSAIFAPTPQLGLIIIDEEHETTFKQQTTPRYHARDVARERARLAGIPLILGSATPTLESILAAKRKESIYLPLPKRVAGRPLPPVALIDTRNDPQIGRGEAIGRAMQQAVRATVAAGGQVILFLNLRGYSPVVWCGRCNKPLECPHCSLTLTWHKDKGLLLCHSCEHSVPQPQTCLNCGMPGLRYLGVGTQRLENEVATKFPGVKTLRMDSDSMRKPGSHDIALEAFRKGEVRILLGTQMIAKGLDFPNVTLVGVIDADTLLHQPDLRATERTFQLIAQVSGRTGRGDLGGRVLVQTACPDERVIRLAAAHDFNSFARTELAHREALKAPPFVHFARVIFRGLNEELVKNEARRVATLIQQQCAKIAESSVPSVAPPRLIGPAPAPVLMLKKFYRYHLQLAHVDVRVLHQLWRTVLPLFNLHADVELTIDVDPLDMR